MRQISFTWAEMEQNLPCVAALATLTTNQLNSEADDSAKREAISDASGSLFFEFGVKKPSSVNFRN